MSVKRARNRTEFANKPGVHHRTVEVWHADDRGDVQEHYVLLPQETRCHQRQPVPGMFLPCMACPRCDLVGKVLLREGQRKIAALAKEGYRVNPKSIRLSGPYRSPEEPDMDTYVIGLRAWREKPVKMGLDEASHYDGLTGTSDTMTDILRNAQYETEAQAEANREAMKLTPTRRAAQERVHEFRRRHGLPEFKAEPDDD